MERVHLFHWRAEEAKPLVADLKAAGYAVTYPGDNQNVNFRSLREGGYKAVVIDLTRLPSHGRHVAQALRISKATSTIPIVFLDGDADKVAKIRQELPDALYTTRPKLAATLKKAKPVADPIMHPRPTMEIYSGRTTAQKLGFTEDCQIAVIDAPPGYAKALGALPPGTTFHEDPDEVFPLTLWFVHDPDTYLSNLPRMKRLCASKGRVWVIWPKAASKKGTQSGVTQPLVRESALQVGLVDYKICSVNETWSGMLFTLKK